MVVRKWLPFAVLAGLSLAWLIGVLASGSGYNPLGVDWNFERTSQFGDSFGGFSALMAGSAAVFSYLAFTATRDENTRLRNRDAERDIADRLRDSELSFFRLCELRQKIVADMAIEDTYADVSANPPKLCHGAKLGAD